MCANLSYLLYSFVFVFFYLFSSTVTSGQKDFPSKYQRWPRTLSNFYILAHWELWVWLPCFRTMQKYFHRADYNSCNRGWRKLPKNPPSPEIYIGLYILNLRLHLLKCIFRAAETNVHQYKSHIFAWLVHFASSWCKVILHSLCLGCFSTVVHVSLTDYETVYEGKEKTGNVYTGTLLNYLY